MLYDLSALRKLSDNDEAFIIDMLQTFKKTTPPILQRMAEYVSQKKFEAVGREAHKLIPGVSFLGAKELKDILVIIEETAKSGEGLDKIPSMVKEVISESNELIACFENDFPGKI
jgi:HPt (histidine-containing phosphotransfer) domain-containing protein